MKRPKKITGANAGGHVSWQFGRAGPPASLSLVVSGELEASQMAANREMKIEQVDLATIQFTPELLRSVPADVARRFEVLPIYNHENHLGLVMRSPAPDLNITDQLYILLGRKELEVRVADPWVLSYYIHKLYRDTTNAENSS